jgi:hypothetical protein
MEVAYSDFKNFVTSQGLSAQYIQIGANYLLAAVDGFFQVNCLIPADPENSDTADFITNLQPTANQSPTAQVVTQFEKRDKTLKIASIQAAVGGDGRATLLLKIPGTFGTEDGRWISSGIAFFDTWNAGDMIESVRFTDEDNLLGGGAGAVIGSYTDEEVDDANKGWPIPPNKWIKAEAIGGYGFAPAGFYIKIVGKKAAGITTGTLYVALEWGKKE